LLMPRGSEPQRRRRAETVTPRASVRSRPTEALGPAPPASAVSPVAVVPVPSGRTSPGCPAAFECAATADKRLRAMVSVSRLRSPWAVSSSVRSALHRPSVTGARSGALPQQEAGAPVRLDRGCWGVRLGRSGAERHSGQRRTGRGGELFVTAASRQAVCSRSCLKRRRVDLVRLAGSLA
jgi:hypothetical protein